MPVLDNRIALVTGSARGIGKAASNQPSAHKIQAELKADSLPDNH